MDNVRSKAFETYEEVKTKLCPRTTTTQREPPLTFAVTSRLFLCIYICYIFLNKNSIMLYTLFYKLLFLLTHIVYLSSSVHIGLGFTQAA